VCETKAIERGIIASQNPNAMPKAQESGRSAVREKPASAALIPQRARLSARAAIMPTASPADATRPSCALESE